jgi:transcription initiation factor IIF auxiliary subunit
MRLALLVVTIAALLRPAVSQAETPAEIATVMVRLCVGGGSTEIQDVRSSGSINDLSLQSRDAHGVTSAYRVARYNTEGLVSGISNALTQIAADQADKVRDCLAPVRARLLTILLPISPNTNVSVIRPGNISRYIEKNRWEWTIYVSGTSQQISSIHCVVYHLHPTFNPRDYRVCEPGDDPAHAFPFTATGWGTFLVGIDLEANDGSVRSTSHQLRFIGSNSDGPAPTFVRSGNTSRRIDKDRWEWTIYVSGTSQQISSIRCVIYHLHPTFSPRDVRECVPGADPAHAFPLTRTGWGTFDVTIDLELNDSSYQQISHELSFSG